MKVAVVCLAYLQSPAGVEALARYFERIAADVYVHVDAKVPDDAYRDIPSRYPCVHILVERQPIWWGGFNTVRAIIAALEYARAAASYDRFLVLTEDTVPLMGPTALVAHLQQDVEFLDSYVVPNDPDFIVRRHYENWYFFDSIASSPRHFDPADRTMNDGFLSNIEELSKARKHGKVPLPNLCSGSTWWALSEQATALVVDVHTNYHWLRESFRFSAIPEETYIQTILALSDWKRPLRPFLHADFSRAIKPHIFRSAAEIAALHGSPFCMVRKVDLNEPDIAAYMHALINSGRPQNS